MKWTTRVPELHLMVICDWFCDQFKPDPRFVEVKNFIKSGAFGDYDYSELLGALEGDTGYGKGDYFLVGHDFPAYIECQDEVDKAYRDQEVPIPIHLILVLHRNAGFKEIRLFQEFFDNVMKRIVSTIHV